ncbi:MAG TPA: LysM peptidoglycan-binding domain-containing protein [Desulfotomaculum sp.]|nr:LysM peptidoglycan-binding domain-containing protein [Desulfotomaculum sp.]
MKKSLCLFCLVVLIFAVCAIATVPASGSTETPFGSRTLSYGMTGTDVRQLQTCLTELGYYKGTRISVYFDHRTRQAVTAFQKDYQLHVNGILDEGDYAKIAGLLNLQPQAPPETEPEPAPEPPAAPQYAAYVVQPGDTFYLIAQRHDVSLDSLLAANPGVDPYMLQVGQTVKIPVAAAEPEPTPEPGPEAAPHVLGYCAIDYTGDSRSYGSLNTYGDRISSIATFSFLVDGFGNVTGSAPRDAVGLALEKGVIPLAMIHNYRDGGFSSADAHELLSNRANRQRLIQRMITILKDEGYQGVNIDLENIPYTDRSYYTALIREFKAALEPLGYLTVVSVPAKASDAPTAAWSGAFDYRAIGASADWVQIMTYDEHWAGGVPGPIASLPWVQSVIKYAVSVIPKEKILLGIATYGYDWGSGTAEVLTYQSVNDLVKAYEVRPHWHEIYGEPFFYYYKDGVKHEVWYEDAAAASLKLDLVNEYGLKGIGIWRLGFEDATFWQAVAEKL